MGTSNLEWENLFASTIVDRVINTQDIQETSKDVESLLLESEAEKNLKELLLNNELSMEIRFYYSKAVL